MKTNIEQTTNKVTMIGVLSEKKLELKDDFVTTHDGQKIPCKIIVGSFSIKTIDNKTYMWKVKMPDTTKAKKERRTYKSIENLYFNLMSEVDVIREKEKDPNADVQADVVCVSGAISLNSYVDQGGNMHKGDKQFWANSVSTSKAKNEDFDIDITFGGVVADIVDEMYNEEPTGRKILQMVGVDYRSNAMPMQFIVGMGIDAEGNEVNFADQIEDYYSVGDNAEIFATIRTRTIGAKPKKASFGRASKIAQGFERSEYIFTGGMEPMEEIEDENGESNLITMEQVKMLMNERNMMLQEIEANGYQGNKGNNQSAQTQRMGTKKPVNNEVADLF